MQQSEVLQYLTREEVEDKAASGKVGFEVNYNGRPAAETEAIVNALQSYEDGIFRIFIDDTEAGGLCCIKRRNYTDLYPTDYAIGKIMVSIYNNPKKTDNHENHLQ